MESRSPLVTITTDFGTEDAYVPAMKGTMRSICPEAQFVDVTHKIHPQAVMETAFVLQAAYPYFPEHTIHLVVVDPGVGTDRRAVALQYGTHLFVGPDNGIFPLVLNGDPPDRVVELDNPEMWRTAEPSTTFHGRDIFAPAAAHLADRVPLEALGSPVDALEPLQWARPSVAPNTVQGLVVHVDHFGNCITNIRRSTISEALGLEEVPPLDALSSVSAYAGNRTVSRIDTTYGAVPEGDPLLLFGSTGFLEIGVNSGSAADMLDIQKGDAVNLEFGDTED